MNRAAVSIALLACLVGLGESQSRGYQRLLGENALRKYHPLQGRGDGEVCCELNWFATFASRQKGHHTVWNDGAGGLEYSNLSARPLICALCLNMLILPL
uniref:Conotoxin n=1 Tax=Mesocestoides corti TaxID=53468 RepID=A0A5K3EPF4_MESCO